MSAISSLNTRLPRWVTLTPFTSPPGMAGRLMFRSVSFGKSSTATMRCSSSRRPSLCVPSVSKSEPAYDTAMLGMPATRPPSPRPRCRVEHVLAHVLTMVDPGDHEIRLVVHQRPDGEQHAVRRGTVHLERAVRTPRGPHRPVQRERVRRAALLPIRGDDRHLAERGAYFAQDREAACQDAVIVRDQDVHRAPKMICRP